MAADKMKVPNMLFQFTVLINCIFMTFDALDQAVICTRIFG